MVGNSLAFSAVTVNRNKIWIAVLSIAFYFVLDYSFVSVIQFNYAEFESFHIGATPTWKIVYSFFAPVVFTILLVFLPTSSLLYTILFFILIIIIYPSSILSRHINSDFRIILLQTFYFLFVYLIANNFSIRIKLPVIARGQRTIFLLALSAVLIVPFIFVFGPHINPRNLLLDEIYESRDLEADLTNVYTAYLYAPLSNVILPLLLLMSSFRREYGKAVVAFGMLLFMFLVGAHKSVFFGIIVLIYFSFGGYYNKIIFFLIGLLTFVIISIFVYQYSEDLFLTSLINRRVFFLPAILDVGYFRFFEGEPLYWSESLLKSWVEYPHDLPAKNLVSEFVTGDVESNANNGIISDGFMNFGFLGAMLNIIFVSIVYGILNSLQISHRFFGVIFLLFFTFFSSFFFTSMLTQGGLLLLIVAYFFLRDTANEKTYQ